MSIADPLDRLAALHRRGSLTDAEFAQAKARVLQPADSDSNAGPAVRAVNGLRRSRDERWLGGVCGGMAQSTGAAAWLWRMVFVLFVLCAGAGGLVYLLMWVLVPLEDPRLEGRTMQAG